MDRALKELIEDYVRAYKAYNKKEEPTSYDYTLMQSPAIEILTREKMGFHITYTELYEWCQTKRKAKDEAEISEAEENLVIDNKENEKAEENVKIEEKIIDKNANYDAIDLFDNV